MSLTIIAIGTPPAAAAVGLVRMSGEHVRLLLNGIAGLSANRGVTDTRLHLGDFDLPCVSMWMPGPASYTGEDVAELLLPGNALLMSLVVERLIEHGVAQGLPVAEAAPGEYTYRAWRAGRLSFARAESVMQLVHADSEAALACAHKAAHGAWHDGILSCTSECANLLAIVEAGIDFTDEEDVVLAPAQRVAESIEGLRGNLATVMGAASGQAFVDARPLVRLCGPPSAGKSTLFNALLGRERSVTMHTPHTTRDVLVEPCAFPGIVSARLADTPGVDADTPASGPTDVDVWCTPWPSATPSNVRGLVVHTKADLATSDIDGLAVSAHTGEGIDALRDAIGEALLHSQASANTSMLSARQHAAIERTDGFLVDACDLVRDDQPMAAIQSPEIVALLLRESLDQLGAITGDVSPDDVLGLVFSSFCVGK